jgi:primosomal protein N' (replication factor Y)
MLAKGLGRKCVSLVGIMNADNIFVSSRFLSIEEVFQMMTQVAGRSGRSRKARNL